MRRFRHFTGSESQSAGIDMSPLMDIVFILLIFFVVTSVFVDDPGVETKLPRAASAEQLEKQSILLAVTEDGGVYFGGRNIGVDGVGAVVSAQLADNAELPVVIQGDTNALHGVIMKVTDAAQLAGAKKVYQATAK